MMSSALPAATRSGFVDEPNRRDEIPAGEEVGQCSAELARPDDSDIVHVRYCMRRLAGERPGGKYAASLGGKVAVVTGGSRGIGLAIARALAAESVQVAVIGRSEKHLSEARPRIEGAGPAAGRNPEGRRSQATPRLSVRFRRRSPALAVWTS